MQVPSSVVEVSAWIVLATFSLYNDHHGQRTSNQTSLLLIMQANQYATEYVVSVFSMLIQYANSIQHANQSASDCQTN